MITVRHLLCHVYPRRNGGVWQANLDQIFQRIHLFNGEIVFAVAEDETTDCLRDVGKYVHAAGVRPHWLLFKNDPSLREVVSHESLWSQIPHLPGHATFYCHAKGVTHAPQGPPYFQWARLMYAAALDYWPLVDKILQTHLCAGSFRKETEWPGHPTCKWHYSGSFYWIRNDALAGKDWRWIDREFWGVETWPSRLFTLDEAGVIFFKGGMFNPADHGWFNRILADWDEWKRSHANYRTAGPPSNPKGSYDAAL